MLISAHEMVQAAKRAIAERSAAEIEPLIAAQAALLIDVREPDEYRAGHLAGAINIPRGLLEFRISSDPALQALDRRVVVYCKTGGRAALAAQTLQQMGFGNVVSLAGGFDAWAAEGRAVAQPRPIAFE